MPSKATTTRPTIKPARTGHPKDSRQGEPPAPKSLPLVRLSNGRAIDGEKHGVHLPAPVWQALLALAQDSGWHSSRTDSHLSPQSASELVGALARALGPTATVPEPLMAHPRYQSGLFRVGAVDVAANDKLPKVLREAPASVNSVLSWLKANAGSGVTVVRVAD